MTTTLRNLNCLSDTDNLYTEYINFSSTTVQANLSSTEENTYSTLHSLPSPPLLLSPSPNNHQISSEIHSSIILLFNII